MQSPNKETDPHVFAIETLLAAHAEKAPPLVHDPAAPAAPPVHIAPAISVGAAAPHVEPVLRAPDVRDVDVQNARPSEIKVDGLQPSVAQPMRKGMKRVVMAILALLGATAAAGWQHYGDQAKATALEWTPTPVLAAIYSATRPAAAAQPSVSTAEATVPDQTAAPQPLAATSSDQSPPAVIAATPPSAEPNQLQAMTQDLAAMGRQVEDLKATIAQLKANQAQLTRELAKSSEAKVGEMKPVEPNPRPKISALTPPPPRPVAPPVRKPKPVTAAYAPAYTAAPAAAAPLSPAQAAAPPPPPAPTIAEDGQPVVRPPMPLR